MQQKSTGRGSWRYNHSIIFNKEEMKPPEGFPFVGQRPEFRSGLPILNNVHARRTSYASLPPAADWHNRGKCPYLAVNSP
jgi:hypothetical protein